MLSVVLYGRNDSHGYNLHKRAALSINCIAELLEDTGDEILFVDCNSPDDFPTFLEAIQDTLTEKAKRLIKIFRLRQGLFEAHKRGTHLRVHESLCRNIAIRRSNPTNRWILSTNTDMIILTRKQGTSLSDILKSLPGGFYELPRFELPEVLWEALDRKNPEKAMAAINHFGEAFRLNVVVHSGKEILFDGPGDFQLMLRDQIIAIHGFNEEMVLGWHVDSNLCKRFYLLNGETKSLLDHLVAYHCDHTRQATAAHCSGSVSNDLVTYFDNVTTPYLPAQAGNWGLADEIIEDIRLHDNAFSHYAASLEHAMPTFSKAWQEEDLKQDSFNSGLSYDVNHVLPYLVNEIAFLPADICFGYIGSNIELLNIFTKVLGTMGFTGKVLCESNLCAIMKEAIHIPMPSCCVPVMLTDMHSNAGTFIIDGYQRGEKKSQNNKGVEIPFIDECTFSNIIKSLVALTRMEKVRVQSGHQSRRFILLSFQNTDLEVIGKTLMDTISAPYSNRVRQGFVRNDVFGEEGSGVRFVKNMKKPFIIRENGKKSSSLCKVCDVTDYDRPEIFKMLRDILYEVDGVAYTRHHQSSWEQAVILAGLKQLGVLRSDGIALVMSFGWERILAGLTKFVKHVEGKVIKDNCVTPFIFPEYKLNKSQLKNLDLPYQNHTFDFVVHLLTTACNNHSTIRYSINELKRVIKPGGILVTSIKAVVEGNPSPSQFKPEQIYTELVFPCELDLVGDIDFSITAETLDACVEVYKTPDKRPFMLEKTPNSVLITCLLFARMR